MERKKLSSPLVCMKERAMRTGTDLKTTATLVYVLRDVSDAPRKHVVRFGNEIVT